jgi:hypothetical protein
MASDNHGGDNGYAFDFAVRSERLETIKFLWEKSDKVRFAQNLDVHFSDACFKYCSNKFGTTADANIALYLLSIMPSDEMRARGIGRIAHHTSTAITNLEFLKFSGVKFSDDILKYVYYDNATFKIEVIIDAYKFFLTNGANPNAGYGVPLRRAAKNWNSTLIELPSIFRLPSGRFYAAHFS